MEESTFYNLEHLLFLMREMPDESENISIYKKWISEDGYLVDSISDVLRTLNSATGD